MDAKKSKNGEDPILGDDGQPVYWDNLESIFSSGAVSVLENTGCVQATITDERHFSFNVSSKDLGLSFEQLKRLGGLMYRDFNRQVEEAKNAMSSEDVGEHLMVVEKIPAELYGCIEVWSGVGGFVSIDVTELDRDGITLDSGCVSLTISQAQQLHAALHRKIMEAKKNQEKTDAERAYRKESSLK